LDVLSDDLRQSRNPVDVERVDTIGDISASCQVALSILVSERTHVLLGTAAARTADLFPRVLTFKTWSLVFSQNDLLNMDKLESGTLLLEKRLEPVLPFLAESVAAFKLQAEKQRIDVGFDLRGTMTGDEAEMDKYIASLGAVSPMLAHQPLGPSGAGVERFRSDSGLNIGYASCTYCASLHPRKHACGYLHLPHSCVLVSLCLYVCVRPPGTPWACARRWRTASTSTRTSSAKWCATSCPTR
jgi:hypothetical protein